MSIGAQSRSQLQECGHKASWATLNGLCSQSMAKKWNFKSLMWNFWSKLWAISCFFSKLTHRFSLSPVAAKSGVQLSAGERASTLQVQRRNCDVWRWQTLKPWPSWAETLLFVSTRGQETENPCRVNVEIIRSFLAAMDITYMFKVDSTPKCPQKMKWNEYLHESRHSQPFRNFTQNVHLFSCGILWLSNGRTLSKQTGQVCDCKDPLLRITMTWVHLSSLEPRTSTIYGNGWL